MLAYVSCSHSRLPCLSVSRLVILFSLGEPPSPVVTYLVSSSERLGGGWRRSRKEKELPLCRWRVQQVRMVGMVKALPSRPALPLLHANSHQLRERLKVIKILYIFHHGQYLANQSLVIVENSLFQKR